MKIANKHKAVLVLTILIATACANIADQKEARVERMYVLYCGEGTAADQSRWSPGVNVGKPIVLSNSCYLIKHPKGWMLWETGYSESIASMPEYATPVLTWRWKASKTLSAQLAEIGVTPSQVTHLGFSHAHPDHVGNGSLFPTATLYVQEPEYDFYLGPRGKPPAAPANWQKLRSNPVVKLHGDYDVFGDGSVTILSSPGHTPGHQSLLVRLPKTGAVLLTGDAAHFKDNWDHRRAPVQNYNKEQTIESMDRLANIAAVNHAQIWINHDPEQTAQLKKAPAYIE
jgi:glyoxylase-like metal-dependent hydrolase (beta-lactamase superfamily II)